MRLCHHHLGKFKAPGHVVGFEFLNSSICGEKKTFQKYTLLTTVLKFGFQNLAKLSKKIAKLVELELLTKSRNIILPKGTLSPPHYGDKLRSLESMCLQ